MLLWCAKRQGEEKRARKQGRERKTLEDVLATEFLLSFQFHSESRALSVPPRLEGIPETEGGGGGNREIERRKEREREIERELEKRAYCRYSTYPLALMLMENVQRKRPRVNQFLLTD